MAWNRSTTGTPPRQKARSHRTALIGAVFAAVAVVGVTAACFLLFPDCQERPPADEPEDAGTGLIAAVTPQPAAKASPVPKPALTAEPATATSEVVRIGNREYDLAKLRKEEPAKFLRISNEYARVQAELAKYRREPVQGVAEQLLVMVSPLKKGDFIPPPPIDLGGNPQLEKEAEAMLERVGQVETWDDEVSVGIKERLEALKDEWYAAKKGGQSFHDFLTKRLAAANFDTQTLDEARQFDRENYADRTMSDEDYAKSHEKVNKLLEMQGFEKIKRPDAEEEDDN